MEINQEKTLLTNLYNSRDEGQLGIVVMNCAAGQVLAHRNALAAGSDYFRGMFSHRNIENDTNIVSFPDTSTEVMNIIIKYIYAQKLPIPPEITDTLVRETFIAADRMQMADLFDKYWTLYTIPITLENLLNIWPLADMFNRTETKEKIRQFVLKNTKQIPDMNAEELDNIFGYNVDKLEPDQLGDVLDFLLNWVDKNEDKTNCVSKLLSKFDVTKLPDHALRKLMSDNKFDVTMPEFHDLLSKRIVRRWLVDAKPRLVIHAFENINRKWKHSVYYTNSGEWLLPVKKELKNLNQWFPAVSGTGELFYSCFSRTQRFPKQPTFVAYESSTSAQHYCAVDSDLKCNNILCETANFDAVYFRRNAKTYSKFDFCLKRWEIIDFNDLINNCECLLLVSNDKYFFDVDDRRIKIVDRELESCVVKEKLTGSWKNVRCKNLCNGSGKLLFFQDSPNRHLLVYDIGSDSWEVVPAPHIKDELVMFVCYYDDCLVFENSVNSYNVYSLKTMAKVTEYKIPVEYGGRIYFDASVMKEAVLS